jgi:hypothetical protein
VKKLRAMRCSVLWMAEEVISRRGIPISLVDTEEREQEISLLDSLPALGSDRGHGGRGGYFRDGYGRRRRDTDGGVMRWGRWGWGRRVTSSHRRHYHYHHPPPGGKKQGDDSGGCDIWRRLFYGINDSMTRNGRRKQKLNATERDSEEEEDDGEEEEEGGVEEVEEVDWVSKVIGPRGRKTIALQQQLHLRHQQKPHHERDQQPGIIRVVKKIPR